MIAKDKKVEEAKSQDFVLYLIVPPGRRYPMGWYRTARAAERMQRLSQVKSGRPHVVVLEDRL